MMAYHLESTTTKKSELSVSAVSKVSVEILHQDVQNIVKQKYPDITHIQLTTNASVNGMNYREGMIVVYRSIGGLPEFAEVFQMVVVEKSLSFIIKEFVGRYKEHFGAFELCPTSQVCFIQHAALVDHYHLVEYRIIFPPGAM